MEKTTFNGRELMQLMKFLGNGRTETETTVQGHYVATHGDPTFRATFSDITAGSVLVTNIKTFYSCMDFIRNLNRLKELGADVSAELERVQAMATFVQEEARKMALILGLWVRVNSNGCPEIMTGKEVLNYAEALTIYENIQLD